jgi:hypothetical protein
VIGMMRALDAELAGQGGADFVAIRRRLAAGVDALAAAGEWLVAIYGSDVRAASAGAVPFLTLLGIVAGGWQMARAALIAQARIDAGDATPSTRRRSSPRASMPTTSCRGLPAWRAASPTAPQACWGSLKTCSDRFRPRLRQAFGGSAGARPFPLHHGRPLRRASRPRNADAKPTQTRPDHPDPDSLG